MNDSPSRRATFALKGSNAALKIIADWKEHLRRAQKWRERFEAYSFPDAGELKRRIREEGLMLRAEDCACLRYAVGCLEHREKAAEWFRGLAEVLQGMADTHGAEAKAVALRFRRILDDSDPAARLDEALGKCADFAERCFIGGARPETPATAPAAEMAETRHREIVGKLDALQATGDETRGLVGEIRTAQMTKKERQSLAGKVGAAKGAGATSPKILKARDEAARDLQEACKKVKRLIDKGSSLDAACREVCDHFRELPGSKKGGKVFAPLLSARLDAKGSRIKMELTSLMRRYGEWCKENGLPSPREQVKQAKTKKRGQ